MTRSEQLVGYGLVDGWYRPGWRYFRRSSTFAAMEELRRQLCDYGRRAAELGLVIGTSGNLSARDGDLVTVTPSGVALDRLRPEDCPVIRLDGTVVEGDLPPS